MSDGVPASPNPAEWARHKTVLLETRRRNGTWVPTPVHLAGDDAGRLFFRTYDAAGKAKRLRNFPDVRVAPCNLRGKPRGPSVPASVRLLDGAEADHARAQLARRWPVIHGRLIPWLHRRRGWKTLHYELRLGSAV